jgi:hypothetical protein
MTTTERTAGRGAGRDYGIWLLAASIATAAAVVLVLSRHLPGPRQPLGIPWWALLLAFYAAECLVVHVHFRRRTQTLTLAEIPLLLGLYSLSPLGLLAAQLGGSGAALLLFKRQRPQKAAVTLAQTALGTSLALVVYRSVVRGHDPYGPTGWVAGFAAAETATFAGVVLLAAAVAFTERGAVVERIA